MDATTATAATVEPEIPPEHIAAAEDAGLRYVIDTVPGFTRRRSGEWFEYFDERGRRIDDEDVVARIDKLAQIYEPKKTTYAEIRFTDFPPNQGDENLKSNDALVAQMREVDAIALVLRDFTQTV